MSSYTTSRLHAVAIRKKTNLTVTRDDVLGTIPTVTEGSKVRDTRGFRSVTLPQTPSKNPTGGKTEVEKRSETGISLGSLVAHKEVTPHESDGKSLY